MNEISNFVLYTTPNGDVNLDILLQDENLWLTQKGFLTCSEFLNQRLVTIIKYL